MSQTAQPVPRGEGDREAGRCLSGAAGAGDDLADGDGDGDRAGGHVPDLLRGGGRAGGLPGGVALGQEAGDGGSLGQGRAQLAGGHREQPGQPGGRGLAPGPGVPAGGEPVGQDGGGLQPGRAERQDHSQRRSGCRRRSRRPAAGGAGGLGGRLGLPAGAPGAAGGQNGRQGAGGESAAGHGSSFRTWLAAPNPAAGGGCGRGGCQASPVSPAGGWAAGRAPGTAAASCPGRSRGPGCPAGSHAAPAGPPAAWAEAGVAVATGTPGTGPVLSGAQDSFGLACSRRLPFRWGTSARRLDRRRHLADDRPGLL
jgi:hypothetical protein